MEPTEKLIIGLNAKMQSLESTMSEVMGVLQELSQRVKQVQFSVAGGFDPNSHTPKGESDSQECDDCGKRRPRKDMMKRTVSVEDKLVVYTVCKGCFYHPTR